MASVVTKIPRQTWEGNILGGSIAACLIVTYGQLMPPLISKMFWVILEQTLLFFIIIRLGVVERTSPASVSRSSTIRGSEIIKNTVLPTAR